MLPNEILPAIPRQKVKHINRGHIATVLVLEECGDVVVDFNGNAVWWRVEDCEPVPEEPSGLRVGDKVAVFCDKNPETFAIITAKNGTSYRTTAGSEWANERLDQLRHATPSEVAQYFN